jgi:hypothetical protein
MPPNTPRRRSAVQTLLRSLGSTVAIVAVVFVVTELRFHRFALADFAPLIGGYWKFFVAVFFALAIWDHWFWRVQRRPHPPDDDRNQ